MHTHVHTIFTDSLLPTYTFSHRYIHTYIYIYIDVHGHAHTHTHTYIYIYMYIFMNLPTLPHEVNFLADFNRFEFMIFLLLDWWLKQEKSALSILLFTRSWKNIQIRIFPKCISAMWSDNSLVQVLNSSLFIHYLQR